MLNNTETTMNTTDSKTCGASATGYNVYRFIEGRPETEQEYVGAFETMEAALRAAKSGDQIQAGLDGDVTNV
jgi:hypothetical protein